MLEIHETTDLEELSAAQGEWEIQHRPATTERCHGRLMLGRIGGIRVDVERWNTPLELAGMSPQNGLSFALPLHQGASYLSSGHAVTANRIDIFPRGCEVSAQIRPQGALISCTLPTEMLEPLAKRPFEALLALSEKGHSVLLSTPSATADLRRWWLTLLEMAGKLEMTSPVQDRLFDETLLRIARVLTVSAESDELQPRSGYLLARRARDFMLDRQANPPSIGDVCVFLDTSERTLHNAFRQTYGVSPKRFLKAHRLFAARQALSSSDPQERVNEIAWGLGFWDLGRFARDYRTMFGEYPSSTLLRSRA